MKTWSSKGKTVRRKKPSVPERIGFIDGFLGKLRLIDSVQAALAVEIRNMNVFGRETQSHVEFAKRQRALEKAQASAAQLGRMLRNP